MVQLEAQNAYKETHLDKHGPEVPVAVALQVLVVAVLSQQRHLSLGLDLLGGCLDSSEHVSHTADVFIAGQLDLLCKITLSLSFIHLFTVGVIRNDTLAIVSKFVLDLLTLVLVGVNRQSGRLFT